VDNRLTLILGLCLTATAANAHAPLIGLSKRYLNFVATPGGAAPPPQVVALTNDTHGRMPWNASLTTTRGGAWLRVSPTDGVLPGVVPFETANLTISVTPIGLPEGAYYGTVTIRAQGDLQSAPADNSPQIIEVALTIGSGAAAPGIGASPSTLTFEAVTGGGRAGPFNIQITNTGAGTLNWTAAAETTSGGNWLGLTAVSGSVLSVSAPASAPPAGVYTGRVVITAPGAANSPLSIPVTLRLRDPSAPALAVSAPSLLFSTQDESRSPAPQRLDITNAGEGTLRWRVDVLTYNGGAWLSATPGSGLGPGPLTVSADSRGLGAGSYAGRLTITADGASSSPTVIPVTLAVRRPQPEFESRGVVNAATLLPGFLAPGELLTLFGARLGPREGVVGAPSSVLAGTRVYFDGFLAPLLYVSYGQINLQVPFELAGRVSTRVVLSVDGLDEVETTLPLREASPGLFTWDGVRAAAVNQNGTLNGPQNPAERGTIVQLYLTGQGVLDPPLPTGAPGPMAAPFPLSVLTVRVTMDGLEAPILFAGAAPGFVGLTQINAEIPRDLRPSTDVNVAVLVGPHPAGKRATLAVK
jgi:uncharacterized protein (TIGR03437 family)